jgi:Domain of unknown function (DUF4382)
MPNMISTTGRFGPLPAVAALLACALLAGCQSATNVSATGNTAAQFTHVFLTINQIWFNASASAGPTDASWVKFPLATPQTIDLVTLNNGTLSQFATDLKLAAGTYAQVMVILADSTDALSASAQSAGAATNDEVDYFDSSGVVHTVPLAVLNAAQGISVGTSLTVAASSSTSIGGLSSSSAPTSSTATSTTSVAATTSALVDFDATVDLVPISLSGQPAFLLNPHPHSYNVANAGTIQGSVSLTGVSTLTDAGYPDVQVSAEALSSDGTRHVIVKTSRVGTDGTFILYPLSTASGAPGTYDLVIHGPTIQTLIVKSVPVAKAAPGSTLSPLGMLTLTGATPFLVNLSTSSPASPTSSLVGFYQTLPLSSEVPYLVEVRAVDPTSGLFASAQNLAGGSVQYGTFGSGTISLTTVTPSQGAATYAVGAINPAYGSGTLGTKVTAPANPATTASFTLNAPPVPTGSSANAIQGTISVGTSAYDTAELLVTHNGALVAAAPLTGYLGGSQGPFTLSAVAPGGSTAATYAAGVYNAEVWAWNSANPTTTLTRIPYASTIDMSAGNATGVALTIN